MPSPFSLAPATGGEIFALREQYRREMSCQIIHDSIHRRPGWTQSWKVAWRETDIGFGSIAVAGPWLNRPTLFEFYLVAGARRHAAEVFGLLIVTSGAGWVETQTNDLVLGPLLAAVSPEATCEKIIFSDHRTTALPANGASLRRMTSHRQDQDHFENRDGRSQWDIALGGHVIGRGGVAFHYNAPFGDVYMEIDEPFRRRGFGSYFVQELKRICRELGGIPGARCSPDNLASLRCCHKAGFMPGAKLMSGPTSGRGRV